MMTGLLAVGFIAGVGVSLLALKVLPVKVSFNWGEASWLTSFKKKAVKLHPKYCSKCETAPCQDDYDHKFD